MKPIIIPVENGKITLTLAEFRKYMEDAYSQGYSDGCSTSSISTNPNNPYWWRDVYCNTTAASSTDTNVGLLADSVTANKE